MSEITKIEIEKIKIPPERITSVFEPEILEELKNSIKVKGILVPINCLKVNNDIWLIDGLHRIEAAKQLGMKEVPAIIKEGTEEDLLVENLIMNRMRGKSNPAQEAKLIKKLFEDYKWSFKEISRRLGMSPYTAKKYYDISKLPDQVLNLVAAGYLHVNKAWLLLNIPDDEGRIRAAQDIVKYGYNEEQVRSLVEYYISALNETPIVSKGPELIKPESESYIYCEICGEPMTEKATYHWIDDDCWRMIIAAFQELSRREQEKQKEEIKENKQ